MRGFLFFIIMIVFNSIMLLFSNNVNSFVGVWI